MSTGLTFASLLTQLRRSAGLTQLELAERAHIGVRTLRDLETGHASRPQRSTVGLLAAALGLEDTERMRFIEAARGRTTPPPAPAAPAAPHPRRGDRDAGGNVPR